MLSNEQISGAFTRTLARLRDRPVNADKHSIAETDMNALSDALSELFTRRAAPPPKPAKGPGANPPSAAVASEK